MICPYCNQTNVLTWERYWKSPTGKHECSSCNKIFKLAFTINYFLMSLVPIMVLTATFVLLVAKYFGKDLFYIGMLPAFVIGSFIDKYCDDKYRMSVRMDL